MQIGDLVTINFNGNEETFGLIVREIPSEPEIDQTFEVIIKNEVYKLETDGDEWYFNEDYDIPVTSALTTFH